MKPSLALVSPAIRTVIVAGSILTDADGSDPEPCIETLPLLAIRVEKGEDPNHESGALMVWLQQERMFARQDDLDFYFSAWELVVCPWDPSEDESRLAPVVARIREGVESKINARPRIAS